LKSLFNNIYSVEKVSTFKKVDFGQIDKVEAIKESSKQVFEKIESADFDEVVYKIRNDINYKINEAEQLAVLNFFDDLKREANETLITVKSYKEKLVKDVKESKTSHLLDLKKKPELQKYAKEIFQEEKDSISLDDYFVLLELKKQLEVDEFIKMSEEE